MLEERIERLDVGSSEAFVDYETKKFTCYGVRLNKGKIIVTINNKNAMEFQRTDFPADVDFADVNQLSSMIDLMRQEGLPALIKEFNLPEL